MNVTHTGMSPFAKVVLWFVAINALVGAVSLLEFPALTDHLFFWTIAPPINARLFGALYFAGAVAVGSVTWRGEWEATRFLVPVLVVAGLLISLVTLLHIDTFTQGVRRWYWLIVYVGAPMLAIAAYVQQEWGGANWSVVVPITSATRRLALSSGSVVLLSGLAVLVWPAGVVRSWPWPIGVLMLRIFAAWFSAFGAGLLWVLVERDWRRIAPLATLMSAASGLDLVMIVLHQAELTTTEPRLWIYCAHLAGFGLLGLLMHWLQRKRAAAPMGQATGKRSTRSEDRERNLLQHGID